MWLGLCLFLFVYSFEFDKNIEIYKFGATAWPRTIILLIAIAAIGQLAQQWKRGDQTSSKMISAAVNDGSEDASGEARYADFGWYMSTLGLLVIPFAYLRVPDWVAALFSIEGIGIHFLKIVIAAILIGIFAYNMRRNTVGAMLALPLFFGALLEDMGFYSLAPFFIIGVMYLFGERRTKPMVAVMALIMGLLLMLFVSILYVGLPTGNIHPFYDIGTSIVTLLQ